jgi:acid phosphatase (class A)
MPSESLIVPRRFLPAPFLVTLLGASGLLVATNTAPPLPPWNVPSRAALLQQIPLPPARNSPEEKQDIAEVLKLQAAATPEQIALAKRDYHLSVFTFSEVYGKTFTPKNFPKTAALFRQVNDLVDRENDLLKNHFHRPHPFEVDPRVKRIVVAHPGYSYPSYHSARSVVFANVLSLLDPSQKGPLQRVARRVEVDRALAGEHFPSDIPKRPVDASSSEIAGAAELLPPQARCVL